MVLHKSIFLSGILLIAGVFAGHPVACFAQDNARPNWMGSTTTKVKPEMRKEFERYLKQLMAAYKQAGTLWFLTLETFAGDTTEYTTVVPVMKFGELDGPSVVTRVLGNTGWERLSRNMAHCYTAQSLTYATPQTELEIDNASGPSGVYWVETSVVVAPGRMGGYLNWLKDDYRPALEKAGVTRFRVWQPILGTVGGTIVTMRMLKNLAEIDGGAVLSRALSDEQARTVAAKSVALVTSSTTHIVRMRSDLSYAAGK